MTLSRLSPLLILSLALGQTLGASEVPGKTSGAVSLASNNVAAPASAAAVPLPKATIRVDASAVSEGVKAGGLLVSYADVLEPVQRSVVSIRSWRSNRQKTANDPMLRQFFGENQDADDKAQGLGSGVILSAEGYIVTNYHVIEDAEELKVQLFDEREFVAKVVGGDPKTDVAVIRIEADHLSPVVLADSERTRVGDIVFALGNPLGVGQTVTMGIVSALGRNNLDLLEGGEGYESFIQTDAAINMGNSGGALIDAKGRLVGINTAIMSPSRGSIGIGFAIPANLVLSTVNNLIDNGGVVRRGLLGVQGVTLSEEPGLAESLGLRREQKGVVVMKLSPEDGPAAKAGLRKNDVIVSINERPVRTLQELRLQVSQIAPGQVIQLHVLRETRDTVMPVTVGLLETERQGEELWENVKVSPLSPSMRRQYDIPRELKGLLVTEVGEHARLKDKLAVGLLILEVNRVPVASLREAREALVKGRSNIIYVYQQGSYRSIALPVK